jgi:fatty acid synthase
MFPNNRILLKIQGTKVGDPIECKSISSVYCRNRQDPLLVGSVKSNMGHSEVAAAICSIIKAIFAFETGKIAPNINFTKPRSTIESLQSGILKVVSETQELEGSLIGLNAYGIGGSNGKMFRTLKFYISQQ